MGRFYFNVGAIASGWLTFLDRKFRDAVDLMKTNFQHQYSSFHAATFQLLNSEPKISRHAQQVVIDSEIRLGVELPQSVRDWYCREGAVQILAEHSNADPPETVESLKIVEWQSRRLLPIRYENQGVCTWAVHLDGSEDPPIYVDVDTGGKEWQLLSPSFSQYVFSCVWDYGMVFFKPALVQAQNQILSHAALKELSGLFHQETQTHGWPGSANYRFSNQHGAILIWASERQADWFVGASDANGLGLMLRAIWRLDNVGAALYEISDLGKEVLVRFRNHQSINP